MYCNPVYTSASFEAVSFVGLCQSLNPNQCVPVFGTAKLRIRPLNMVKQEVTS